MNRKEFNEKYLNITKEFVLEDKISDIKKIKKNLKFYKYYDLKDKYTIENIENGIIHFSNPQSFNDPFDCACGIDFDKTLKDTVLEKAINFLGDDVHLLFYSNNIESDLKEEEINSIKKRFFKDLEIDENTIDNLNEKQIQEKMLKYFSFRASSMNNPLNFSELEYYQILSKLDIFNNSAFLNDLNDNFLDLLKQISDCISSIRPNNEYNIELKEFENYIAQCFVKLKKVVINSLGIICLSESYDNVLMWAHYSNKHTGICVEYDFTNVDEMLLSSLLPVEYKKERPIVTNDLYKDKKKLSFNLLSSSYIKSKDWKYEKEWRILLPLKYLDENLNYKSPKITKVFFGLNVEEEQFKEYKNRIHEFDSNIECLQLQMHYKNYSLVEKK